jgi:hypothetical protein
VGDQTAGFDRTIYLTGERASESATAGRDTFDGLGGEAFAIADGAAYALPDMGRFPRGGIVIAPNAFGDETVVFGLEDGGPGLASHLYMYVGVKDRAAAHPMARNGLVGGKLYVLAVPGESGEDTFRTGDMAAAGTWVEVPNAAGLTDAQLAAFAQGAGAFNFVRLADGAFDPAIPRSFYFTTTGSELPAGGDAVNGLGRVYQLEWSPSDPTAPPTLRALLEGDAGDPVVNPAGLAADARNQVMLQEAPTAEHQGPYLAGRDSSTWVYDRNIETLTRVSQVDQSAVPDAPGYRGQPGEWQATGVTNLDIIFGRGTWLFAVRARTLDSAEASAVAGSPTDLGVGEGGQLAFFGQYGFAPFADLNGSAAGNFNVPQFTEDGPPVPVAPDLVVVQVAGTTVSSATVTLARRWDGAAETLSVDTSGTPIAAAFEQPGTDSVVLRLTGTGTLAEYQQVLRTVRYSNASDRPTVTTNGRFPTELRRGVSFALSDGGLTGSTDVASVGITAVNDLPVAAPDRFVVAAGAALTVAVPGVLANDADVDGPGLTAELVAGPSAGTLTLLTDGSFTFAPAAGFAGTAAFTYRASDGQAVTTPVTVDIVVVPPPPVPPERVAVGGGVSLPVVRLVGSGGEVLSEVRPFGPSYTGEVHTASGDVTGDGVPDLVVAAGSGGGPHVKVLDGATGDEVLSFFAYDPAFRGGVWVAAGDVNGDGFADVVTGAGLGGGPHVKAFDGRTLVESDSFLAFDPSFTGGVFVG